MHTTTDMKTTEHTNLEMKMKKSIVVIALMVLGFAATQNAMAQASASQNFNLAVDAVYKITTSGNPAAMTITTGVAGTDALTTVSDASTTYNMTQNSTLPGKITASIGSALPAGYSLAITLASVKGTSAGSVDISNGTAKDVVTAMAKGADAGQTITYVFGANASAGVLTSTAKTVTLTLTN